MSDVSKTKQVGPARRESFSDKVFMVPSTSTFGARLAQEIYDEFLVCKICLESYQRPKCLSCLHTFCEDCIESHVTAESAYKKYSDYREFTCPLCRKRTQLAAGGVKRLPDNFLVASLAEIVVRQRPPRFPQCDICKALSGTQQDAKSKCLDCSKLLCPDCVQLHRQTPITSGHAVFNAEVEKEIECRSHNDEPVRFYCDDCDTCVCVLCTFHAHRGHRVMSFHDAAARQRAVVLGLLDRCRRRIDSVDELVGALNGCDQLVSDTTQTIHDTASAFIQEIRNSESRLIKELHSLYGAECMDAVERRHELSSLREELRSAASLTELIVDSKDIELLLLKDDVQNKLGNLTNDDATFRPPPTASKVVRFVGGSLDLGYVYDVGEQSTTKATSRRARWVAREGQTPDGGVTLHLEEDTTPDPVLEEIGIQTDGPPVQTDAEVQTESAARAFSMLRKDLPQFSRPAKHFVK